MNFSRADSRVRMWRFSDISETNSVPIFRACCCSKPPKGVS